MRPGNCPNCLWLLLIYLSTQWTSCQVYKEKRQFICSCKKSGSSQYCIYCNKSLTYQQKLKTTYFMQICSAHNILSDCQHGLRFLYRNSSNIHNHLMVLSLTSLCVGAKRGYCSLFVCVVCVCVCLHYLLPLNYYNLATEALAATKV